MSSFKAFATAVTLVALSATAFAQQDDLSQLVANRDKKLASSFLRCANWSTDFDGARADAKASGRLIFGYFTRSYAPCGPCMQLEQTVFAKPEFAEFSKSVVLFCHISTRIPSDPNAFLFAEKGGSAFPTVMVLDENGNVLARQCGERSMHAMCAVVGEGQAFAGLIRRAGARGADLETRYECVGKQIELGHFTSDVARAEVRDLGPLSLDRKDRLHAAITSRECALALLDIRKAVDEDGRFLAARKLIEMKKAGHVPSDSNVFAFWEWIMSYASRNQDVALYEDGLTALKVLLPDDANRRERLQESEHTLERLKREVRLGGATVLQAR